MDIAPVEDVVKGFKDIIFQTYNVQTKNGRHIVGGKKKFEKRVSDTLKETGVKLGGIYSGGAEITDNQLNAKNYKILLPTVFPIANFFTDGKGGFALPDFVSDN